MQTIKILTSDLTPVAEIDAYNSLSFTRSWHGVGDFELHINRYAEGADKITKGSLIALDRNKVGIVKHREITLDENGKGSENWVFKGYTLKGIMSQRITLPPAGQSHDSITAGAETVMKHYVNNNVVAPDDPDRAIESVSIISDQQRGSEIEWRSRFKVLAEELKEISKVSGIGWEVLLNSNGFDFECFVGRNLSVNQSDNSPVFFSPDFENVKGQSFTDSDLEKRNVGYAAGQGEGDEREVIEVGSASGIYRYETFIDARDVETTATLTRRGEQRIQELDTELFFEAEILTPVTRTVYETDHKSFLNAHQPTEERKRTTELYSPFIYERDFDIGDIVTIMNRGWGVMADRRITEITEIHEPSGFKLEAVFGQKRPTLISKIKDEFKQHENELKR